MELIDVNRSRVVAGPPGCFTPVLNNLCASVRWWWLHGCTRSKRAHLCGCFGVGLLPMARTGCMCKPSLEINAVVGSAPDAFLVGLGAIPGAWLRLKVVNHFQPMVPKKHWGTFIVNVVACFALGLVLALNETCNASTGIALLMGVGFFGSLSTFSTFAVELLNELRAGQALTAVVLALASIGAGLLASALGYGLGTHA